MSGGSYNYLCFKEIDELINMQSDLQDMSDRLAGLGYATDAARETQELIQIIRQSINRMEPIKKRLYGIWHAVEWWDSCDSGEDDLKSELKRYRGEK